MSKNKKYSANPEITKFSNNLGFKLTIFDNGTEPRLKTKDTDYEIDAILYNNNIVNLVELYGGKDKGEVKDKIKKHTIGLKDLNKFTDMKNNLHIVSSNKLLSLQPKKELKKIIDYLQKKENSSYETIIKKIIFCPLCNVDAEIKDEGRKKEIFVFDREIYSYLEQIYDTLGKEYLYRELVDFLTISKVKLGKIHGSSSGIPPTISPLKFSRLEIEKDKIIIYSGSCTVNEIESMVTVFRPISKKYDTEGFQRMLKKKRIESISNGYLKKNETFPNNIIIALDPELYSDESKFWDSSNKNLTLFDEYNSLLIIDGQHRFFSLRETKRDCNILVTFIFYNDKTNKAIIKMCETFYEINKRQERVDPGLDFVLKAKIDKKSNESFWFDVLSKLNNSNGFFKNKISFKEKQLRYKDEESILSVIKYGGLLKLNHKLKNIDGLECLYKNNIVEDKKFATNLLNNYFNIISSVFSKNNRNDIKPREIGAFIRLIRHFFIKDKNLIQTLGKNISFNNLPVTEKNDIDQVKNIIEAINFENIISSNLSSSNWAAVEGLLLRDIHKKYINFGSKKLLSKKGIVSYES